MYDVIVIGAGPAGLAAAVYTAYRQLKTLLIAPDLGGQARYRMKLPWLNEREVLTGEDTVEQLRHQLISSPHATRYLDSVENIFRHSDNFHVISLEGGAFAARAVIVSSGVRPRPLGVPGERRLMGYGVTYSATSHAPLFAGRRTVVVGDDLRALRAVAELRLIAGEVTLVWPDQADIGGYTLGKQLLRDERVTVLPHYRVCEIVGEDEVAGVIVAAPDGRQQTIPADGVFIELGLEAQTDFLGKLVERTPAGQIVVDERCATSCAGVFAAGDVTSAPHAEQILIALGEGVKAALSVCTYLVEESLTQQA